MPPGPIDEKYLAGLPQPERIRMLVGALDRVVGEQPWKYSMTISNDPIVKALIREGDAAVPSLIDAIASDERESRAVFTSYDLNGDGKTLAAQRHKR